MKIGIFDSGIGGLSVLHQAMITMPEADYIFYADVDNVPYGEKTKEEVRKLVDHAVGFLVDKGCQAIVLACNTATSAAISYLREKYKLPIIGIEPAVKPAVEHIHESGKRVMVVSTPVTAKGEKLKKLVDKYDNKHIVDVVALPKLVRFAQDDDFDSSDVTDYLKSEFAPYNLNDYSELVLGCTHFNYFKDSFSKLFPDDLEMVDGNTGVSNNLKNTVVKKGIFKEEDKGKKGTVEYYYSDRIMGKSDDKTNVCRVLDQKKVPYKTHVCPDAEGLSGDEIAAVLNENPEQAFKTLVTVGKTGKNYVFVVPVNKELDLKKAAKAVGEKSIEMIKSKELLPLTGYVHGGCSPIGMKKFFPTTFHKTAEDFETIMFSAGKIGHQVEVKLSDIDKVIRYQIAENVKTTVVLAAGR